MVFLSLLVQIILLQQSEPSLKKAGNINYLEIWPVVERYRVCSCAPFFLTTFGSNEKSRKDTTFSVGLNKFSQLAMVLF